MKTKLFTTCLSLLFILLITPNLAAQFNNSVTFGFKATNAQFGVEAQYSRAFTGMMAIKATAGLSTISDNVSGADLARINANTISYGLGLELTPFGNNAGLFLQSNVMALHADFTAEQANSFLLNGNCTTFQSSNNNFSFITSGESYSGSANNLLLDTRIGYRVNIKGSRVSFAPFVAFEKIISDNQTIVLNNGQESVNYNQDRNLRTTATQINNSSVSVNVEELYKSNRFNTGFEMQIRF